MKAVLIIFICFLCSSFCLANPVLQPDTVKQKKLEKKFLSLQDNPQYFRDSKCRKKVNSWEVKRLVKKVENFGKKIFMKSWTIQDMEKNLPLFGKIAHKRKFNYFPEEIADGIAPYIDREVKKLEISEKEKTEFDDWFEVYKRWGLSYFCFSDRNLMVIVDGQNGNYFQLGKKAYFIKEKYQKLIDMIMRYKEKPALSKSEKKAREERKRNKFRDLNEKFIRDKWKNRFNKK